MRTYLKLKHFTPAKALDLADGQWLNGDLYIDDKGVAFIAPHCEVEDFPAEDARPIDPHTICLQTNLLDSRGFPLYDHDIVHFGHNIFEVVYGRYNGVALVANGCAIPAEIIPEGALKLIGNVYNKPDMFYSEC